MARERARVATGPRPAGAGGGRDRTGQRRRLHVAVVGGGVSGLTAALTLAAEGPRGTRVTIYEKDAQVGGKLRTSRVAGVAVDEGAESFLMRDHEVAATIEAVGLAADLVRPVTTSASLWTRHGLRSFPGGTVLGVPSEVASLAAAGVLTPLGLARAGAEPFLPGRLPSEDVAVGALVSARFGREVSDVLVDPLLGGVYAGRADDLSFQATMPALATAAAGGRSLMAAARQVRTSTAAGPGGAGGTVAGGGPGAFGGLVGGLGRLPGAIAAASTATVVTGTTVCALTARQDGGWRLELRRGGPADELPADLVDVDAVVVATPAPAAARLLSGALPFAATTLAGIEYASVAIVTLAFRRRDLSPPGSGFLSQAVPGRTLKAVTFSSGKWAHVASSAQDVFVVRCSVGRFGEVADLQRDDADIIAGVVADLRTVLHVQARPIDARLTRWGGALPQYTVGHLSRVASVREAVSRRAGLAVCGAAYDGVGVPACLASGQRAARDVLASLTSTAR